MPQEPKRIIEQSKDERIIPGKRVATRERIGMIVINISLPPAMTEAEERSICKKWTEDARTELAKKNARLALFLANKWESCGLDPDELVSTAMYGLVKAAAAFQPDKGIRFCTFASRVIENEIRIALRREKRWARLISLETPVLSDGEGGETVLQDTIAVQDQELERIFEKIENQELYEAVDALPEKERSMILMFMAGKTQMEIAAEIGINQSHVSRSLKKIFAKLRRRLERMM